MASKNIVKLAKQYAAKYHEGQFRKGNGLAYIIHPKNVARLLKNFGVNDNNSLSIAWLHDTLEDTCLTCNEIYNVFGAEITLGIYLLTKEGDREEYKRKISYSPKNIKIIKLCDVLDNIRTLEYLKPRSIERIINDCKTFYLPMAEEIKPEIAEQMKIYLNKYL